nr:unnamed protein product [Spirometra erinaceieuropaei]
MLRYITYFTQYLVKGCEAETGDSVPGVPNYTRRIRLYWLHCLRTSTHRMGLFGHMHIHDSGIDPSLDIPSTAGTSTKPDSTYTLPPSTPTTISSTTLSTSCTPTRPNPTHTRHSLCPPSKDPPSPTSPKPTLTPLTFPVNTVPVH